MDAECSHVCVRVVAAAAAGGRWQRQRHWLQSASSFPPLLFSLFVPSVASPLLVHYLSALTHALASCCSTLVWCSCWAYAASSAAAALHHPPSAQTASGRLTERSAPACRRPPLPQRLAVAAPMQPPPLPPPRRLLCASLCATFATR